MSDPRSDGANRRYQRKAKERLMKRKKRTIQMM